MGYCAVLAPIGSEICGEVKEVLRCFPDTVMATARRDTKMGSCSFLEMLSSRGLLRLARMKAGYITSFFDTKRTGNRESSCTAVERTHSLLLHLSKR